MLLGDKNLKSVKSSGKKKKKDKNKSKSKQSSGAKSAQQSKKIISIKQDNIEIEKGATSELDSVSKIQKEEVINSESTVTKEAKSISQEDEIINPNIEDFQVVQDQEAQDIVNSGNFEELKRT